MEIVFQGLVLFTLLQRIAELLLAKKNEKHLISLGAKIIEEKNYIFMVFLHSTWLGSLLYFSFFETISFSKEYFYLGILLFVIGQILRLTAIFTLGKRWSTRIMILPEATAIRSGIFRYIRHPNYLGVIIELFALPLIGSLFGVAIIFSILNLIILYFRIQKEEYELNIHNDYNKVFALNE